MPSEAVAKAYLHADNWDDWGKYRTMFQLTVFDHDGVAHKAGNVKIGHIGLAPGSEIELNQRAPALEPEFDRLPNSHFSLGQNETYYETLNELPADIKAAVLEGLKDCAFNLDLFDQVENEMVMSESLLRDVSRANVRNRLHRLAIGDAVLTAFELKYQFSENGSGAIALPLLIFQVVPNVIPPTNVHVLIGRNGVGKTRCMQNIARSLLVEVDQPAQPVDSLFFGNDPNEGAFAGLVIVSFSAFDDFDLPVQGSSGIRISSIGLRYKVPDSEQIAIKAPAQLKDDFTSSFGNCREGLKAQRWLTAVQTLSNDPLFEEANVISLLELDEHEWKSGAETLYTNLSSGHKIVLLTITRLVELVDERTLVLLDEPEGHLHPPLLSAFVRSLANLLVQRNGVAIVATHSPVVLQEVPSSCVWMLRRSGAVSIAERPTIETFGESVGVLTREVFGLEVTTAGFHQLIRNAVARDQSSFDQVIEYFGGNVGAEGRAIARALVANRDGEN